MRTKVFFSNELKIKTSKIVFRTKMSQLMVACVCRVGRYVLVFLRLN